MPFAKTQAKSRAKSKAKAKAEGKSKAKAKSKARAMAPSTASQDEVEVEAQKEAENDEAKPVEPGHLRHLPFGDAPGPGRLFHLSGNNEPWIIVTVLFVPV